MRVQCLPCGGGQVGQQKTTLLYGKLKCFGAEFTKGLKKIYISVTAEYLSSSFTVYYPQLR